MIFRQHLRTLKVATPVAFLLTCLAFAGDARGADALRFANIFNGNMVLQQGEPAAVWGWAEPGAELTVVLTEYDEAPRTSADTPVSIVYRQHRPVPFQAHTARAVAGREGAWRVTFPAMDASFRPKRVTVSDGTGASVSIDNILVGEVWLCSGQSNMSWPGAWNKDLWVNGLSLHGIRYTKYDDAWYRPLDDLRNRADWHEVSKESIDRFASVAYVFARHLHLNLGVPVGIINNARGGTLGISWTSRKELLAIKAPVVAEEVAAYEAQAKEWETPEYAERLAKARREVAEVWRPKARLAIEAFWDKHDAFMKANLSAEKYAEWRKIADAWHVAKNTKHNGGPDDLKPWKVWGLERKAEPFFKGTDIVAPVMNYQNTLWKERPDDSDARTGRSPPAGRFNAGTAPLKGMEIAGVLYYQGENENFGELARLEQYREIFPTILPAHRKLFGNDRLPFGIISLAGWGEYGADPLKSAHSRWPYIMEIHAKTHERTPGTGLIVIHDVGHASIHPPWKQPVGERAARWALSEVYGLKVAARSFRYVSSEAKAGKMLVRFAAALPGTFEGGRTPRYRGFAVAGSDRRWYPADVRANVTERALEVWSEQVPEPVAVRYGWAGFTDGNLGSRVAPVPLFRSDDWPIPRDSHQ